MKLFILSILAAFLLTGCGINTKEHTTYDCTDGAIVATAYLGQFIKKNETVINPKYKVDNYVLKYMDGTSVLCTGPIQ